MLLTVMREVRNFFTRSQEHGVYAITNGSITLQNTYHPGQYILITGSTLNNGVYLLKDSICTLDGAQDDSFEGTIYALAIPPDFIALCNDITQFEAAGGAPSPYTSESVLGVHSWSKAVDKNGAPASWKTVFATRLAPYRKMFHNINI